MSQRTRREPEFRFPGTDPQPVELSALAEYARRVPPVRRRRTNYKVFIAIGAVLALASICAVVATKIVSSEIPDFTAIKNQWNDWRSRRSSTHTPAPTPISKGMDGRQPRPDEQFLDGEVRGWSWYVGPDQFVDADGYRLPEWRDEVGRYAILKAKGGYIPAYISGEEHRRVGPPQYYATFADAAAACGNHKAAQATMFDMIGAMAESRKVRPVRPANEADRARPKQ